MKIARKDWIVALGIIIDGSLHSPVHRERLASVSNQTADYWEREYERLAKERGVGLGEPVVDPSTVERLTTGLLASFDGDLRLAP